MRFMGGLIAPALMIALAGCGDDNGTGNQNGPELEITVSPTVTTPGVEVNLQVFLQKFQLEEPIGQPNVEGHGHYHVYLGNTEVTYSGKYGTQVPIPANTSLGVRTLKVQLFNNDFSPVVPAVVTKTKITVE